MDNLSTAISWLCDMDGVLINEGRMVPGADKFLDRLRATDRSFLVLTNNALFTPQELRDNLAWHGVDVLEEQLWTSALATAQFVHDQRPKGRAFVIGEASLHDALRDVGYSEDTVSPDYVVLGETWNYSFDEITMAIRFIDQGCSFVVTNPETFGTSPDGLLPGCGALAALIHSTTGVKTILVLSGVTQRDEIEQYSYQPSRVINSVADLIDEL